MDIKQIQYILSIAEHQSISKAADALYMTQSALNQQLLKLERELGISLFERVGRGVVPTYAGRVYLENAQKIVNIKNETYKMLQDISDCKYGEISIAYTPERGARDFTRIYCSFRQKYPHITFQTHEARINRIEQLLEQKRVTIGLTGYHRHPNPNFNYHYVKHEYCVLVLPSSHPLAYLAGEESWRTLPHFDLKLLEHDFFVLPTQETLIRRLCDELFHLAGFTPKVLFESSSTAIHVDAACRQIAPAFISSGYITPDAPVVYFSISKDFAWHLALATHKDVYLSRVEQDFINFYIQDQQEHYFHHK